MVCAHAFIPWVNEHGMCSCTLICIRPCMHELVLCAYAPCAHPCLRAHVHALMHACMLSRFDALGCPCTHAVLPARAYASTHARPATTRAVDTRMSVVPLNA
eukprot:357050-Chlamydomonas_euryale.AAC.5